MFTIISKKSVKVAQNYYYVASTTAINNAAASHKINYALNKKLIKLISHGFIAILSSLSLAYATKP